MTTGFIESEFPNAEVIESADDGINESYYFKHNDEMYVGKIFKSAMIETEDYLASIEINCSLNSRSVLNTPEIVDYGVFGGYAYLIYRFIDGDQLEFELLHEDGRVDEYTGRIGEMVAELHSFDNPVDGFGWFTVRQGDIRLKNGYEDSLGLSLSSLNYNLDEIEDAEFVDSYGDVIRDVFEENLDYKGDPVICHCDVKFNNIIDSSGDLYLIDWEFLRSADPLYDYVKMERSLFGVYDRVESTERDVLNRYRSTLRDSYFGYGDVTFDDDRYRCYWILEMVECFNNCADWYPQDDLDDVRSYYKSVIDMHLDALR